MQLSYIFIKKYRNIANQGFTLSNQFAFNYDLDKAVLEITSNSFHIESFYGENISGVTGIVGENGTGKTTFLKYIYETLCFPISANLTELETIVAFYDTKKKVFHLISNGFEFSVIRPSGQKIKTQKLKDFQKSQSREDFENNSVFFGLFPNSRNLGVIYHSAVIDNNSVRNYGPQKPPFLYNISANYFQKLATADIPSGSNEIVRHNMDKAISMALNLPHDLLPEITLPEFLTVTVNTLAIDDFLRNSFIQQQRRSNKLTESQENLSDFLSLIKKEKWFKKDFLSRMNFYLVSHLLINIADYLPPDVIHKLFRKDNKNSGKDFAAEVLKRLIQNSQQLKYKNDRTKKSISKRFDWLAFLRDYDEFLKEYAALHNELKIKSNEVRSFDVPLNKRTQVLVRKLQEAYEKVRFESQTISFTWRDLSTGEKMMLQFFAELYFLLNHINDPFRGQKEKIKTLLLLIDEVDAFYHPQWQKQLLMRFFNFIEAFASNFQIQIVFTTHSSILISDLPKSHLVFLRKESNRTIVENSLLDHRQTFGANVHSLLVDSFFLRDGLIGDFANSKIEKIIDLLVDGGLAEIVKQRKLIENTINIIGEPIIKAKLLELYENRIRANIGSIKHDIETLKRVSTRKH